MIKFCDIVEDKYFIYFIPLCGDQLELMNVEYTPHCYLISQCHQLSEAEKKTLSEQQIIVHWKEN